MQQPSRSDAAGHSNIKYDHCFGKSLYYVAIQIFGRHLQTGCVNFISVNAVFTTMYSMGRKLKDIYFGGFSGYTPITAAVLKLTA